MRLVTTDNLAWGGETDMLYVANLGRIPSPLHCPACGPAAGANMMGEPYD